MSDYVEAGNRAIASLNATAAAEQAMPVSAKLEQFNSRDATRLSFDNKRAKDTQRAAHCLYDRKDALDDSVGNMLASGIEKEQAERQARLRFNASARFFRGAKKPNAKNKNTSAVVFGLDYPAPPSRSTLMGSSRRFSGMPDIAGETAKLHDNSAVASADNFANIFVTARRAEDALFNIQQSVRYGDGKEDFRLETAVSESIIDLAAVIKPGRKGQLTPDQVAMLNKIASSGLSKISSAPESLALAMDAYAVLTTGDDKLSRDNAQTVCAIINDALNTWMKQTVNNGLLSGTSFSVEQATTDTSVPTDYIMTSRSRYTDMKAVRLNAIATELLHASTGLSVTERAKMAVSRLAASYRGADASSASELVAMRNKLVPDRFGSRTVTLDEAWQTMDEVVSDAFKLGVASGPMQKAVGSMLAAQRKAPFTSSSNMALFDTFKDVNKIVKVRFSLRASPATLLLHALFARLGALASRDVLNAELFGSAKQDVNDLTIQAGIDKRDLDAAGEMLRILTGTFVVEPRIIISNAFAHFVAQTPITKRLNKDGRTTYPRVNLTSLRNYMTSQLRGSFPASRSNSVGEDAASYSYPADYVIPARRFGELMAKRESAGYRTLPAQVNQYNISVDRNGTAFYLPEESANQQSMVSNYDILTTQRENYLTLLGLPPDIVMTEQELVRHVMENISEDDGTTQASFSEDSEDAYQPLGGSGVDRGMTRSQALNVVTQLLQCEASRAGLLHLPLLTSQSLGCVVFANQTRGYSYKSLIGNGELSEGAMAEVKHSPEHAANMFPKHAKLAKNGALHAAYGQLYALLAEYGNVPAVATVLAEAKAEWEADSGMPWNAMTAVELDMVSMAVLDVPLVIGEDGNPAWGAVQTSNLRLTCVDPDTVSPQFRPVAEAMLLDDTALNRANTNAVALQQLVAAAATMNRGVAFNDGSKRAIRTRLGEIARKLVNLRTGSAYDSPVTSSPNYFMNAFNQDAQVWLSDSAPDELLPLGRKRSDRSLDVRAGGNDSDANYDDLDQMFDDSEKSSDEHLYGMKFDDAAAFISDADLQASDNPFAFFSLYLRASQAQKQIMHNANFLNMTVMGRVLLKIQGYLFEALNDPESAYRDMFFPVKSEVAVVQRPGTEDQYDYVKSGVSLPVCNYEDFYTTLMPTLFAGYAYETNRATLADNFRPNRGKEAPLNPMEAASFVPIPNLRESTRMMRHQVSALVRATADVNDLPRSTVESVKPGGGKTFLGLAASMRAIQIALDKDDLCRPLIVSPVKLTKNWFDDAHKFFGSGVNIYPIASESLASRPADLIRAEVEAAPPNTVFVTAYSFLSTSEKFSFMVGTTNLEVRANLDYLLSYGFNYAYFDESHRGKNSDDRNPSEINLCMASIAQQKGTLTTEATGTFVHKDIMDSNGQGRIADPGLFMSGEAWKEKFNADSAVVQTDSVVECRKFVDRTLNYIQIDESNWEYALPKPVYIRHLANSLKFRKQEEDADSYTLSGFEPDLESEYYLAMRWMCDAGFYGADPDGAFSSLMADDMNFNRVYNAYVNKKIEEIEKTLLDSGDKLVLDDFTLDEMESVGSDDDDDSDDDATPTEDGVEDESAAAARKRRRKKLEQRVEKVTAVEHELQIMLQQLIQLVNDPQCDPLNGTTIDGADGRTMKVDINVVSPKMRLAHYIAIKKYWSGGDDTNGKIQVEGSVQGRKTIVIAEHVRSAMAFIRNLPQQLRDHTRLYIGGRPQHKGDMAPRFVEELDALNMREVASARNAFETDDNVWILVATEKSLSEGFNLQIADTMLRLDSPWSPGQVTQTSARVRRPDLASFVRDEVFLHWFVADNTLEVLRYGRLISRIITTEVFNHADDPEYARMTVPPKLSMTMESMKTLNRFKNLEKYTIEVKVASPGGGFVTQLQEHNYLKALDTVRTIEATVRERNIEADLAVAEKYGLVEDVTRVDGTKVKRPRLIVKPETFKMERSRFMLFTPTVSYTTNRVLEDEFGFKTYNLHELLNSYGADPETLVDRHVYTQDGFAKIVKLRRAAKGKSGFDGDDAISAATLVYPDGRVQSVSVAKITLVENVKADNPNLWILNTMIDVGHYERTSASGKAGLRHVHVGVKDGKPVVSELVWDDQTGGYAVGDRIPTEDVMATNATVQLDLTYDEGFDRLKVVRRETETVANGGVIFANGKNLLVEFFPVLASNATVVKLHVRLTQLDANGKPVVDAKGKRKSQILLYTTFAQQYGYRGVWDSNENRLIADALIQRTLATPVVRETTFDVNLPDTPLNRPVGRTTPYTSVALTSEDAMRLLAGRTARNKRFADCTASVEWNERTETAELHLTTPYTLRDGSKYIAVVPFNNITQATMYEKIQCAAEGLHGEEMPVTQNKSFSLRLEDTRAAKAGFQLGEYLGPLSKLVAGGGLNAAQQGGDLSAVPDVKVGTSRPTQPEQRPAPSQDGSTTPSNEASTPSPRDTDPEAAGVVRADFMQVMLGNRSAAAILGFTPQPGQRNNAEYDEFFQRVPNYKVEKFNVGGKQQARLVPASNDEKGTIDPKLAFTQTNLLVVQIADKEQLLKAIDAIKAVTPANLLPDRTFNARSEQFLKNPLEYMAGVFNERTGRVNGSINHRFNENDSRQFNRAFGDRQLQRLAVYPAVYRTARSNGERLHLVIRAPMSLTLKLKQALVKQAGIPANKAQNVPMLHTVQHGYKQTNVAMSLMGAYFNAGLNRLSVRKAMADAKDFYAGHIGA